MYRKAIDNLKQNMSTENVILLLGPRQVGKTTLLKNEFKKNTIYIDLDDKVYRDFFDSMSVVKYKSFIDSHLGINKNSNIVLILDEAQRLKDPGLTAKIFHDQIKNVKMILTGSSTLDIRKKTSESLAGRKVTINLYPLTFKEYLIQKSIIELENVSNFKILQEDTNIYNDILINTLNENFYERLRVGLYPGTLNNMAEEYLQELVDAVILKDIYYMNLVKNTEGLIELLKLLAYQIDQYLNVSDISKRLGIARKTVVDYISILEKTYIIFTLSPFRKERSDEITKLNKIYFYDLGIRNALINDFRPVNIRNDYEAIFKNFIISEIKKLNSYHNQRQKLYFWRTTQGSETDIILEKDGEFISSNIRLYKKSKPKGFTNTYNSKENLIINLENYYRYII